MLRSCFVLIAGLAASTAFAGEFNDVLSYGDAAPAWSELPGTDGKQHALADLKDKKVVVVVFTCNGCPVARDYEDRIIALAKRHTDDVAVVAINVNRVPEDSLAKMEARAREKNFPYPYLYDQTQKIAKDYGATGTPEFFVLSPERKLVYAGSMDDASDASQAKVNYVEAAITAALEGIKPATTETYARGCRIRWARERRK